MAHLRKYKRFMAIGCSHGSFLDNKAFEAVLKFKRTYKPETRVHLGDVCDYAAFRSGATGTKDEAAAIGPDIIAGSRVIGEFQPTDVLIGNHDERVWKLSNHPNAIIAHAASCSRNEFLTACQKAKVKRLVDHYDINRSWIELGDTKVLHGFGMGGENALRDMAEHFGRCIVAHFHAPGMARARRSDHAVGYCVGTLADISKLEYALKRRATAKWGHAFAYGEYSDSECVVSIAEESPNGKWNV